MSEQHSSCARKETPQFRQVPGYDSYYATADGTLWSNRRGSELRPLHPSWNGRYYNVSLWKDGRAKTLHVHVVVCTAFYGAKPLTDHQCRHRDGNPRNNAAENLEWGTCTENNRDKIRHRTIARGKDFSRTILTESQVIAIRGLCEAGSREKDIAAMFNVSQSAVKHIRHRRSWAWLMPGTEACA